MEMRKKKEEEEEKKKKMMIRAEEKIGAELWKREKGKR